jgi:3-hydroxyisobutyrate dehydrogenase-like beta-hydroxyacid dehydrogenase
MSKLTLGFIGLGRMGAPMASRLVEAGYTVTVYDTAAAAVNAQMAKGAMAARSPLEVADQAEIVFASLPTPEIVEKVALGPNGVSSGKRVRVFVDLSTTGPRMSGKVAAGLADGGRITMLDSPVSGGVAGATKGTLTLMVAGAKVAFDELEPVLKNFGKLVYCGVQPGLAQTLKLCNNLMSVASLAVACEALVLGTKAGLDPKLMMDVINISSGRSGASQDKVPKHILPRTFDFGFSTGLSYKDTRLCVEEAEALGVPMIMGNAARLVLTMTKAAFGPDADFTNMIRLFEGWAGVEVRAASEG